MTVRREAVLIIRDFVNNNNCFDSVGNYSFLLLIKIHENFLCHFVTDGVSIHVQGKVKEITMFG
jgi:hypothetical protein